MARPFPLEIPGLARDLGRVVSRLRALMHSARRVGLVVLVVLGLVLQSTTALAALMPSHTCDCPCRQADGDRDPPPRARRPECCEPESAADAAAPAVVDDAPQQVLDLPAVRPDSSVPPARVYRVERTDRRVRGPPRAPAYLTHCALLL